MTDAEIAAKAAESAAANKGAKDEGTPTPEQLRAAQDSAERERKRADEAEEKLAEAKKEREESQAEKARKEAAMRRELGISEDDDLVAELEALAQKGDPTAKAYLKKMEKIALSTAEKIVNERLTKAELEKDFDRRDELVESELEKWNKGKEKADQLTVDKFKESVGKYADTGLDHNPSKQFKKALAEFLDRETFKREKAELEAEKIKNGQFRDGGTSSDKGGEKSKTQSWRDAKSDKEKEAQLATL